MNYLRLSVILFLALPFAGFGQRKEIVELQRDVALLQDQVRTLERTVNEKMTALTVLVQQTLDNVNRVNTSVQVLDSGVRDRLKEQAGNLVAPVAAIGTKVDQMASEFQGVRSSLEDVNVRLGKVERQMVDLGNTVKVIQAPAAPPPGAGGLPPGVSADSLYANARRDMDGGNYDMALQEFTDYLRYFGDTATAPNAQYYIGEILLRKSDLDGALKAFDLVLEKYPENTKTPDAMYRKGETLVKMGQRTAGAGEFRELIRSYPSSELAAKARAQLKAMGLSATTPARPSRKK
jgi:tol-pal system protein YbgF